MGSQAGSGAASVATGKANVKLKAAAKIETDLRGKKRLGADHVFMGEFPSL
jgi:hypothetical protein